MTLYFKNRKQNTKYRKMKQLVFFYVLIVIAMCSCDAIKVVRVTNLSNNTIEVMTDFPQIVEFKQDSNSLYQKNLIVEKDINLIRKRFNNLKIDTISEQLIIRLQPNQHFDVGRNFGTGMAKTNTLDLNHSILSIYTLTDTIIAKNKDEIFDLISNPKTKYIKKTDKERIELNNKYWKNIVIRE